MSPRDEDDLECEKNVARSIQNSFMVKLMIRSLDKAGCPVNPGRHFVCEKCSQLVDGGNDMNQCIQINPLGPCQIGGHHFRPSVCMSVRK